VVILAAILFEMIVMIIGMVVAIKEAIALIKRKRKLKQQADQSKQNFQVLDGNVFYKYLPIEGEQENLNDQNESPLVYKKALKIKSKDKLPENKILMR
jgi:hypothetical protein